MESYREYDQAATTHEFSPGEPEIDIVGDVAVSVCPFLIVYELDGKTYREKGAMCWSSRGQQVNGGLSGVPCKLSQPRRAPANNSMQRTALRAVADAGAVGQTLCGNDAMTSWRRALGFGFIAWLVPFAVAFLVFPFRESSRPLFESIMAVTVTATAVVLGLAHLRRRDRGFAREGILLGLICFTMCVLIDAPLMLFGGPMKMSFASYMADIGLTSVSIPIVTWGLGLACATGNRSRAHSEVWRKKLADSKDLPKVEPITGKMSTRWGTGTVVIPASLEVDEIMRKIPKGKLITVGEIRAALAKKHGATIGCPITTGIFSQIAARAAAEDAADGKTGVTPDWRTLKKGGEVNPKFPGGVQAQRLRLEAEGHEVGVKGKRFFVRDDESKLARVWALSNSGMQLTALRGP